jgi:hypothetical protein
MSYGGLIRILPDMEPSETLATFVHELAHEMLHRAAALTKFPSLSTTPLIWNHWNQQQGGKE